MLVELVLIKKLLANQKSVSATTGVFTPSSATSVDAEKAIEKIQEAINIKPNNNYYKQQLWKFKNTKYKAPS